MHSPRSRQLNMEAAAAAVVGRDDSDRDSIRSSFSTAIDSRRSWISDISFGSSSTVSVGSYFGPGDSGGTGLRYPKLKPHKANQAEWEAIRRLHAASSGQVRLDHFRLLRRLGSGDLGNVYLCELRAPAPAACLYAMKVVDREALAFRNKLHRAEIEKDILRTLDHPFLPTLYADFEAAHYSCLLMEFCPGGDLHVLRQRQPGRRFPISSAKFYAAETLLALEYLHMMGVIYRDLKPENVLVRDDGHIMLSDFDLSLKCDVVPSLHMMQRLGGSKLPAKTSAASCVPPMQPVLSCFYGSDIKAKRAPPRKNPAADDREREEEEEEEQKQIEVDPELVAEPIAARSKSFVGTHEYLAPEVISAGGHGSAVDWWALGVFLYEMIYGRTPFKGDDNEKTLVNILKQPLSFPTAPPTTGLNKDPEDMGNARDLMAKLLVKNPKKRIGSTKGAAEIKRHDFFKAVNWALIRSVTPPSVPRNKATSSSSSRAPLALAVPPKPSNKKQSDHKAPHRIDYF